MVQDSELIRQLSAKIDSLEGQLKAAEDQDNREKERMDARRATLEAALAGMDEDQRREALRSIRAQDDDEMKKMATDYEEKHMKSRKGQDDDDHEKKGMDHDEEEKAGSDEEKEKMEAKIRSLTSRISAYEASEKEKLITELTSLKSSLIPELDEDIYRTKLSARTFSQLKAMHDERRDEFAALKAAEKAPEQKHFGFQASARDAKLVSVDDILNGGGVS